MTCCKRRVTLVWQAVVYALSLPRSQPFKHTALNTPTAILNVLPGH
jgi:hypothetical protein